MVLSYFKTKFNAIFDSWRFSALMSYYPFKRKARQVNLNSSQRFLFTSMNKRFCFFKKKAPTH